MSKNNITSIFIKYECCFSLPGIRSTYTTRNGAIRRGAVIPGEIFRQAHTDDIAKTLIIIRRHLVLSLFIKITLRFNFLREKRGRKPLQRNLSARRTGVDQCHSVIYSGKK